MGEFDIFKSKINENWTFEKTEDVGYPVNTVGDDIFFVVNANAKHGYYSSLNENVGEAGYESEDIYFIDMHYNETDLVVKKCLALHGKSENPIAAKITLIDKETNKISGVYRSNGNTGNFIIAVNPYCSYKLIAEYKGFEPVEIELSPLAKQNISQVDEDVLKIIFNKKP
jgi:pectin methylesterase-like acyl-CoA thioesterase